VWDEDVTARVFTPFTGRIRKITAEIGKEVKQGDVLAEIASPDYGQVQADYRNASSAFRLAERNLGRTRELFDHGAAAQKDLHAVEAEFGRAQSELQRTTARLALYGGPGDEVDQSFQLKSPVAGVVVEKAVNPGQEVRADAILANSQQYFSPLFVVTDPTRLWVQLDATELDVASLAIAQEIRVQAGSSAGQTFKGKIEMISGFVDPATRTIKVRATVLNPQRLLKAEMFVKVAVPSVSGMVSGADVADKAVFFEEDKRYAFVESKPGRYERREVEVGPEHDGRIVVTHGVAPGERVVTEGCLLLNHVIETHD
jgi:cobalt-zinc-cadmium efflux system membrane fusion protein